MKKFKALSRWAFINGLFAGTTYLAVFEGYKPAEHIITFVVILFAILALALFSDKCVDEVYKKETATFTYLPRWVDITYDMGMIGMLLYPGWYGLAAAYTFFMLMQQAGYENYTKRQKEKENEEASSGGGSPRSVRTSGESPQV